MAYDPARHELELRDPTREELFSGPTRELPVEIQQMAVEDTACTFCGVSYFVFAEVQELQKTVKKYKKSFHEFVRFLERERKISQDLKTEVLELKTSFEQISGTFFSHAKQIAVECTQLRQVDKENSSRLFEARQEVDRLQEVHHQLQNQMKRAEEEWKIQSSLTEQKLRNEILHLSSQIENCKLLSNTQESEFTAQFERKKRQMKELEAKFAESQESWTSTERLMVSECDQMKQKLLSVTERVEEEKNIAKQLEAQLKAVQQELSRVVTSNDAERSVFSQLNSEMIMLKHQLQTFEKNKALLLAERAQLQEEKATHGSHTSQMNIQVCTLQKKIEENVLTTEKIKQDYVKELEKMRNEHSNDLHRLRQHHAKAVDELKATQKEYIDFLKKETSEVQLGAESTSHRAHELEKQVAE
uniref:Uncharacterized protein n=1 Tax=Globisporangium ultimum (strain ATCC 200006 / CBS 805.95 / DAOM BR144) TaxID=431595 RepID=K3X1Y5_GLOUD